MHSSLFAQLSMASLFVACDAGKPLRASGSPRGAQKAGQTSSEASMVSLLCQGCYVIPAAAAAAPPVQRQAQRANFKPQLQLQLQLQILVPLT